MMEKKNRISIQFNHNNRASDVEDERWITPLPRKENTDSSFHKSDTNPFINSGYDSEFKQEEHMGFTEKADFENNSFSDSRLNEGRYTDYTDYNAYYNDEPYTPWVINQRSQKGKKKLVNRLKESYKLVVTAIAAIGVGLLFGFMILTIFSNLGDDSPLVGGQAPNTESNVTVRPNQEGDMATEVPVGEVNSINNEESVLIPSESEQDGLLQVQFPSFYVVQAGAFSELTPAIEILEQHRSAGWSGIILEKVAPYRFYIGIANSKAEAKVLEQFYKEQGVETYVREHTNSKVVVEGAQVSPANLQYLTDFLTKGNQLVSKLSEIATIGIGNLEYQLTLSEWNKLQELHRTFQAEGRQLLPTLQGEEKEMAEQLLHHGTEGINALEVYRKQTHTIYLWQVQQAALDYLKQYDTLYTTNSQ
jgi:hypothetical protein